MKILIDTDLGDDLDDAFALMSAMCLGLDIVGVTTVFRDTLSRARMAKSCCETLAIPTPLFIPAGANMPPNRKIMKMYASLVQN